MNRELKLSPTQTGLGYTVGRLQEHLFNHATWIEKVFGLATDEFRKNDEKLTLIIPQAYDGESQYIDMLPNNQWVSHAFFYADTPERVIEYSPLANNSRMECNISIVIWFDLDQIKEQMGYTFSHRYTDELLQNLKPILARFGSFKLESIEHKSREVWRGWTIGRGMGYFGDVGEYADTQIGKYPEAGFRIKGTLYYRENCTELSIPLPPTGPAPEPTPSGTAAAWGSVTGDITSQTDLMQKFSQYALLDHTHDYSAVFAALTHDHNGVYAPISHNHNGVYATSDHNHDGIYAAAAHSHDYAATDHTHDYSAVYAPLTHAHTGVYEPVFSKNTGFNLALGTTAGTVSEGNHAHAVFTTNVAGFVPARTGATTTKYLREDGTWQIPSGTVYSIITDTEMDNTSAVTGRLLTGQRINSWATRKGFLTSLPAHDHNTLYYTQTTIDTMLGGYSVTSHTHADYQATLVSGTNIKTLNNTSLLGAGNINIQAPDVFLGAANTFTGYNTFQGIAATTGTFSSGVSASGFTEGGTALSLKYADINHTHDGVYAPSVHDHSSEYAALNHDHSLEYATLGHDHNALYSDINHTHDYTGVYANASHDHNDLYYTEGEITTLLNNKSNTSHNHDGVYAPVAHAHPQTKAITVEGATASEDILLFYTDVAITLQQIMVACTGQVSCNVVWGTTPTTSTTTAASAGVVTTTDSFQFFTLANTAIPSGSFIRVTTSSASGTNPRLHLTIKYTA